MIPELCQNLISFNISSIIYQFVQIRKTKNAHKCSGYSVTRTVCCCYIKVFIGFLEPVKVDSGAVIIMTFIPEFPIYPPETAWMREPKTDIPGLILNTQSSGARIAFMPADIDRQFARYNLPDHGTLLENIIRWASKDTIPLKVECAGMIDCNLYRQSNRLILHLVNLTSAATWRQPTEEFIPVGPITVNIKLPEGVSGKKLKSLVSEQDISAEIKDGWISFKVAEIIDHEVVIIS